ncbi:PASTA domain-containing protein [uncultured Fibrella sp.]|uniref:PASTA domain-containing protein n=1 Tax=uncultured Fibrella sp. TaxID=1284596 RepID=UPI0035CAEA9D
MTKLSTRSRTDLYIHIGLVVAFTVVLVLTFFFVYLPFSTNHGQTITVPDLKHMSLDELENYLEDRDLRYEVSDCTFVAGGVPLTVFAQYPTPGSNVKEGRKIYLTVIKRTAPTVIMPNLVDQTLRTAELLLRSMGLVMGDLTYEPDLGKNKVLRQYANGQEIKGGSPIAKGTKVDLVVGDGEGNVFFPAPEVVGLPFDEAVTLIQGSGLRVGVRVPVDDPEQEVGTVIKQKPKAGERIRVGQSVDVWVVGPVASDVDENQ